MSILTAATMATGLIPAAAFAEAGQLSADFAASAAAAESVTDAQIEADFATNESTQDGEGADAGVSSLGDAGVSLLSALGSSVHQVSMMGISIYESDCEEKNEYLFDTSKYVAHVFLEDNFSSYSYYDLVDKIAELDPSKTYKIGLSALSADYIKATGAIFTNWKICELLPRMRAEMSPLLRFGRKTT